MAAPTLLDPEGAGRLPADIELATGLGKTSLIALWALAPSGALARKSSVVPRRLAYVVDRRVVVDQASEFAEQVRERLEQAQQNDMNALHGIATTLKNAASTLARSVRDAAELGPFISSSRTPAPMINSSARRSC